MNFFGKPEGRKIHTRDIKLSTYEYDNERLVIEGSLIEKRLYDFEYATGEKRPAFRRFFGKKVRKIKKSGTMFYDGGGVCANALFNHLY